MFHGIEMFLNKFPELKNDQLEEFLSNANKDLPSIAKESHSSATSQQRPTEQTRGHELNVTERMTTKLEEWLDDRQPPAARELRLQVIARLLLHPPQPVTRLMTHISVGFRRSELLSGTWLLRCSALLTPTGKSCQMS